MSETAYIGLGSNIGDKKKNCRKAAELLSSSGRVTRISSFYCTEPVGYEMQEDFINAVVRIETNLNPLELLRRCMEIEAELGRTREIRWGPRTIDLDILLYGSATVVEPDLVIPHPLMHTRRFVLAPLAEIAGQIVHPILNKSMAELLKGMEDGTRVVRCNEDSALS